jgi:hypothetical protein
MGVDIAMNTRRFSVLRNRRLQSLAVALGLSASMLSMGSALALGDSGNVTVTATNTARLSLTVVDSSADYGNGIGPDGLPVGGEISSVTSTNGDEGAYFVWSPSVNPNITVKSNKTWTGSVLATENNGLGASSTMKIANGSLRFGTSVPGTYAAAAAGTAFDAVTPLDPGGWTNHASGVSTFHYYYFLRVDWTDEIGGFNSTVTYSVAN